MAVIGAGKVGTAVARTLLSAGHEVRIAGSGAPSDIALQVGILVPGATAARTASAAAWAEITILSIPIVEHRSLDPDVFAGRVVVDAMNYWPATDGDDPDFADPAVSSSVRIAAHLHRSRVVKTLNHIGYHELESDRQPPGSPFRRALAVISDDGDDAALVAGLIDTLGYDPVISQPLDAGAALEPGSEIFSARMTASELSEALNRFAATRSSGAARREEARR